MIDIHTIRRSNLRRLIHLNYSNNQSLFGRSTGRSESYINRLLTDENSKHVKRMGELITRDFELRLGLVRGWFDEENASLPAWRVIKSKEIHKVDSLSRDEFIPEIKATDYSVINNADELAQISLELSRLALRLSQLVNEGNK